jgi:hypothetical protein
MALDRTGWKCQHIAEIGLELGALYSWRQTP